MRPAATGGEKVSFISLGCPKALVDSERILTQLTWGYEITPHYEDAGVVIVNTCGFIDAAKEESLEAIGEAISENGRVLVTGCMGRGEDAETIRARHPKVWASAARPLRRYWGRCGSLPHRHQPDPLIDLIPAQGVKLTPRHYAYLKISEGCNHSCRFCIIPNIRGDLVSRPIGSLMDEAEGLARAGVRELLVVSQDTSAYGVDLKYQTDFWQGRPLNRTWRAGLRTVRARRLGASALRVPLPPCGRADSHDGRGQAASLYRYAAAARRPKRVATHEATRGHRENAGSIARWRDLCPDLTIRSTFIVGYRETRRSLRRSSNLSRRHSSIVSAASNTRLSKAPQQTTCQTPCLRRSKRIAGSRFMALQQSISASKLQRKVGTTQQILIDSVSDEGSTGRTKLTHPRSMAWCICRGDRISAGRAGGGLRLRAPMSTTCGCHDRR